MCVSCSLLNWFYVLSIINSILSFNDYLTALKYFFDVFLIFLSFFLFCSYIKKYHILKLMNDNVWLKASSADCPVKIKLISCTQKSGKNHFCLKLRLFQQQSSLHQQLAQPVGWSIRIRLLHHSRRVRRPPQ